MNSRRTVILIVAIVIGLVAAGALYQYVSNIEDEAYDNARLVQVFQIQEDIPKGTPGESAVSDELIQSNGIPAEFRPARAVTDLTTIQGKVALFDISAGQVLVEDMFVDPKIAQVTFSERIPAGQVAITVSVDEIRGVAGLLVPGDRVNVIVDDPLNGDKRLLFQNLNILAIGQSAAPEAGETQAVINPGSNLLTFNVPPLAAQKIALVGGEGMYLTLVPPDNQPVQVPPVNAQNLFDGGLTPYPDEEG